MPKICFYFQLHQPYRIADYTVFDVGNQVNYFEDQEDFNKQVFQKVARKSYLPMLSLLGQLLKEVKDFNFTLSCSGIFLEQAVNYEPKVTELIKQLVNSGRVELLSETYHHSLSSLYSKKEFIYQVQQHRDLIFDLFNYVPRVFRNTELVYSNQVAQQVIEMGFMGMLTEGVDRYLRGRSRTQVFTDVTGELLLLLKHAQLSDDVAFRFSDRNWVDFPLHSDRYLDWVEVYGEDEIINLFMDFETFGEHQWEDTGIFGFFENFVKNFSQKSYNQFVQPNQVFREAARRNPGVKLSSTYPKYDVPVPISWADIDRDLTAWIDNPFQQDTLNKIYDIEVEVIESGDKQLLEDWRRLQTSDHFYYMCTKWSADGDVHAYFNPYQDPYEAYRRYSIVLADIKERLLKAT